MSHTSGPAPDHPGVTPPHQWLDRWIDDVGLLALPSGPRVRGRRVAFPDRRDVARCLAGRFVLADCGSVGGGRLGCSVALAERCHGASGVVLAHRCVAARSFAGSRDTSMMRSMMSALETARNARVTL